MGKIIDSVIRVKYQSENPLHQYPSLWKLYWNRLTKTCTWNGRKVNTQKYSLHLSLHPGRFWLQISKCNWITLLQSQSNRWINERKILWNSNIWQENIIFCLWEIRMNIEDILMPGILLGVTHFLTKFWLLILNKHSSNIVSLNAKYTFT